MDFSSIERTALMISMSRRADLILKNALSLDAGYLTLKQKSELINTVMKVKLEIALERRDMKL